MRAAGPVRPLSLVSRYDRRLGLGCGDRRVVRRRVEALDREREEDLSCTADLLLRGKRGDRAAIDELLRRYRPRLVAFVHLRVPMLARGVADTQDLVQDVCERACRALATFEDRGIGSFWGFLRQTALHGIVDVRRRFAREQGRVALPEESQAMPRDRAPEAILRVVAREDLERFERALASLAERDRRALLLRLELDLDYAAIAEDCGFPSVDAARMAIKRALAKVVAGMADEREAE